MKVLKKYTASIPRYPTEICISNKRRPKYYKTGEAPPKKYGGVFYPDKDGYLLDEGGERILKNTKTANLPRMMTINGQKIYSSCHHTIRSKIVKEIHNIISPEFKKQLPKKIEIPENCKLLVHIHFHNVLSKRLPDLDNMASLWIKCGIDCLTSPTNVGQAKEGGLDHKLSIIEDDNLNIVRGIGSEYTVIKEGEESRLDYSIYLVEDSFSVESLMDEKI